MDKPAGLGRVTREADGHFAHSKGRQHVELARRETRTGAICCLDLECPDLRPIAPAAGDASKPRNHGIGYPVGISDACRRHRVSAAVSFASAESTPRLRA